MINTEKCIWDKSRLFWFIISIIFILLTERSLLFCNEQKSNVESKKNEVEDHWNPFQTESFKQHLGVNVDCLHDFNLSKGATHSCLSISGLKISLVEKVHESLEGMVSINPYATMSKRFDHSPFKDNRPLVTELTDLGPIANFAIKWAPRENLILAMEMYPGAIYVPNTSMLSTAGLLVDQSWKQTAISITYNLPMFEGANVKFVGGNGEGEVSQNLDPQQYFGFEFHGEVLKGLLFHGGMSVDGNHTGSSLIEWKKKLLLQNCDNDFGDFDNQGFTTRRMSVGIETDGHMKFSQGLKMGLGWSKSVYSDLNRDKQSEPSLSDLANCRRIDPDYLYLEDPAGAIANSLDDSVLVFNTSYKILDTYFIGFDYQRRVIMSDLEYFQVCKNYENGECYDPAFSRTLEQRAYSFGLGMQLDRGLVFSIAYNASSFAQLYKKIYYESPGGTESRNKEVFNVRIAYNWR